MCHCHVNVDCVWEQPGDNVLGSQAWRISRTYQIVAHWCNSWVPLRLWHALVLQCSRISCVANFYACVPDFRGKDLIRESEWPEKSRTTQFEKVVCHCHVNVDCVSEQPGDNVLGSQAWRISRTYQIVAHWCNSWVPVASLIDRRIRACVPVCLRIWHALVLQCSRISCVADF